MSDKIRVALVGVGNCASCLVQGVHYYQEHPPVGLMRENIGPFGPDSIEFSAAFDVNARKVGQDLSEAIFEEPNNAPVFHPVPNLGVTVAPGPALDGVGKKAGERIEITPAISSVVDHLRENLKDAKTDVVVNFLPVGSQEASEFYAAAALAAGCAFINAIPTRIARLEQFAAQYEEAGLPLIGDDIKSQAGATIIHRVLAEIFGARGVHLDKTYQLNVGGNMDFYNMLESERLADKKVSKRGAVQDVANRGKGLQEDNIHIGPSDFVPFLRDQKLAFIRLEGQGFAGNPTTLEARFEVQDSQNSAGVVFDAIRYAGLALQRGEGGTIDLASAWLMKAPPASIAGITDADAEFKLDQWAEKGIASATERY